MIEPTKHFIVASNLGHDDSLQMVKECYMKGLISKDDFAAALRAHQAAVDDTRSEQRELIRREISEVLKKMEAP